MASESVGLDPSGTWENTDVGEHIGVGGQGGPTGEGVLGLGDPAGAQLLDRASAHGSDLGVWHPRQDSNLQPTD